MQYTLWNGAGDEEAGDCYIDLVQTRVPHLNHTLRCLETGDWVVAEDKVGYL